MAIWESVVENYLGFPDGVSGQSRLDRGRAQVRGFGPYIRSRPADPVEMLIAVGQGATAGQAIDRDLTQASADGDKRGLGSWSIE